MIKARASLERTIIVFAILMFIGNLLVKLSIFYFDGAFNRINGYIKLFFEVVFIFFIIKNFKFSKILFFPLALVIVMFIGQLASGESLSSIIISYHNGNLYILNSLIYVFIFICAVKFSKANQNIYYRVIKILEKTLLINSLFILFGAVLSIEFFRTYPFSGRFGYNGFFAKNGEVSYLYMIMIIYYYYKYITVKQASLFLGILMVVSSLFIGKKVMFLFLFLLLIFHFSFVHKRKKIFRILLLLLVSIFALFSSKLIELVLNISSFWRTVYEHYGLMGAITSRRSQILIETLNFIEQKWQLLNYAFGGIDFLTYRVEFEFIDLFLFLGILGFLIYLYFLKTYFFIKNNKNLNSLMLLLLLCSSFAGGLFISVTCMIVLYSLIQCLKNLKHVD